MHPWTWGDVSFTISVPENTPAVIVLQQADRRYFEEISGYLVFAFDFVLFKKGSKEEIASSVRTQGWARGQSVEVNLEAGEYVVHVRLDSMMCKNANYMEEGATKWDRRILKRLMAQKAFAFSKAANFNIAYWEDVIPTTLDAVAGYDLTELEIQLVEKKRQEALRKKAMLTPQAELNEEAAMEVTDEPENVENSAEVVQIVEKTEEPTQEPPEAVDVPADSTLVVKEEGGDTQEPQIVHSDFMCDVCQVSPIIGVRYRCTNPEHPEYDMCQGCYDKKEHDPTHEILVISQPRSDEPVHTWFSCSICKCEPIRGIRYHCPRPECQDDFDMCEACRASTGHDPTHVLMMFQTPLTLEEIQGSMAAHEEHAEQITERAVHDSVACDGCSMNPIVGSRYKCMDASCPNYDLCEGCINKGIHPINHQMLRLETPKEAQHLNTGASEGASFVLGLRVYTLKSSVAVLGSQLKHGSLR